MIRAAVLALLLALPAFAQADADQERAVDRYLAVVPMSRLLDETYAEMARHAPPAQRERFLADMHSVVDAPALERIARAAMLKIFSTEELNALADFYSSPHGASAMRKFAPYMAEVMPALMQEIDRALQELQKRGRQ